MLFLFKHNRLNYYYNFFSFDSVYRPSIFLAILEFGVATKQTKVLLPALKQIDQLLDQWKSSIQQRREIYNLACQIRKSDNQNSQCYYESLKQYLTSFENSKDETPVQHAVDAAILAIKLENIHQYDDLLKLRAIKQVNNLDIFFFIFFGICFIQILNS